MKIKSGMKDYYDYVAYQYGGGDPRIVYVRSKITHIDGVEDNDLMAPKPPDPDTYYDYLTREYGKYCPRWCVVCGVQYIILIKQSVLDDPYARLYNKPKYYELLTEEHPIWHKPKKTRWMQTHPFEHHGKEYKYLAEISKKLKSPVFTMSTNWLAEHFYIDDTVPNLGDLGFDKLIKPEQMYQNISMWMGNVLRSPPDDNPPKSINNEERIIAHGFDLKTSFRKGK